jgi:hypothetical protein
MPERSRYGTAARWLSVQYADDTTPMPANSRPIRPTAKVIREVGMAAAALSTVGRNDGGTMATTSRCRRSGRSTSTRDRTVTPSSSVGKTLRKP